jgi:hypothetical protein
MKKVNRYFLDDLLNPLVGGADDDDMENLYRCVDIDSEAQIKKIIKEILLTHFEIKPNAYKEIAKNTLSYYLTLDNKN